MFNVLDLDQYRGLFRDESSFQQLAEAVRSSCQEGRPIILERKVIGSAMSAPLTKKMLAERFVQRAIQRPELLDELAERLDCDEVVD